MYDHNNIKYKQIGSLLCDNINTVLQNFKSQINENNKKIIFVGDGAVKYKELIKKEFKDFNILFSENNTQTGTSIVKCAYDKFINNEVGGQEVLLPLYLRLSQAEIQLKNKKE